MKNYQTLGEALDNLDAGNNKPAKLTKVKTVGQPDHEKEKKRKRRPANFDNDYTSDSNLKGMTFFVGGYMYKVRTIKDGLVVTTDGVEFDLSRLRNEGVEFKQDKTKKPARFIKADSSEDLSSITTSEEEDTYRFETDEEKEKEVKNGAQTNSARLKRDTTEVKKYYVKKVPEYKTISTQIELLEKERDNYAMYSSGTADRVLKCNEIINELIQTKQNIDKAFDLRPYTTADRELTEEKRKSLRSNPEYQALIKKSKDLNESLLENSASEKMTRLRELRKTRKLLSEISEPVTLEDELAGNTSTSYIDEEYMQYCGELARIINEHIQIYVSSHQEQIDYIASKDPEQLTPAEKAYDTKTIPGLDEIYLDYINLDAYTISNLKAETINKMLKGIYDTKRILIKDEIATVRHQINFKKQEIMQGGDSVSKYLIDMFDFSDETKDDESFKSKEVVAAVNAEFASKIAYQVASSAGQLHNLDEAIAGAMFGLSLAIDVWFKIQKEVPTTPQDFNHLLYMYAKPEAKKALMTLSNVMASGSTIANASFQHKKQVEALIRSQPSLKHLPREMVVDMVESAMSDSNYSNLKSTVSESVLANTIGGEDGDSVDVWSHVGGSEDIDMVEAQNYYKQVINSISALLNEFDVQESKSGDLYSKNSQMFDAYDRIILLMKFGFTYDFMYQDLSDSTERKGLRIDNTNEAGIRMEATNAECVEACIRYAEMIGDESKMSLSTAAVSTRYNKMMKEKLPLLMKYKPELKEGLKYMLIWIKANPEAIKRMSEFREEKALVKTREELLEAYSDRLEDLKNAKMIDGRTLLDTYQKSQQNNLGDDINNMFNEYMI